MNVCACRCLFSFSHTWSCGIALWPLVFAENGMIKSSSTAHSHDQILTKKSKNNCATAKDVIGLS